LAALRRVVEEARTVWTESDALAEALRILDALQPANLAEALRILDALQPARCFHVETGKRCTRYLEGAEAERRETIAFLKAIPQDVIEDWGLNAVAELIELAEAGEFKKGARFFLATHAAIGAGGGDDEGYMHPDVLASQSPELQAEYAQRASEHCENRNHGDGYMLFKKHCLLCTPRVENEVYIIDGAKG
jgi:hypothetical protein